MKLKARILDIQTGGKRIAILDDETASFMGIHSSDRVKITFKGKSLVAIVNIASNFPLSDVGLFQEVSTKLGVKNGETVDVRGAERPEGLEYIRAKVRGERLQENEIKTIVEDVVKQQLSDMEIASFVTALYIHELKMDEIEALSKAMVQTGNMLDFDKTPVLDKHSIGGVPGDKTTILVVPIIASAGFVIPKTSSRAVTSPAGTADRVETLCPVNLTIEEIKEVIKKTNGCMVWGGALELAPADDIFIQIEYPLGIDPLLLPSIMSKKKSVGATHVIIDIPTGIEAKVKTRGDARTLAYDFIDLGKRLGINVQCAVTFGEQPLGQTIGPALEAKEALSTIMGNGPADLREKVISIAGVLFEMIGIKNGKEKALNLLKSGKAEEKLREIIEAQGGDPKIKPEDVKVGDKKEAIITRKEGRILWINNKKIAQVAKEAGAPKEKGAGVKLMLKLGEYARKDEVLFEIYAERSSKLEAAVQLAKNLQPVRLSKKLEERMLMDRIPKKTVRKKIFMLER